MSFFYTEKTGNVIFPGSYKCRILISTDEFERLETGPWEKNDQLTPYITWCHKHVGEWGVDWEVNHYMGDQVFFRRKEDAMRFRMVWG